MTAARKTASAALMLALAATAAVVLSGGSNRTFTAEFSTVRGLVPGVEVRQNGAPVGSVERLQLTDGGTARVTFSLKDGATPPSTSAAAAVQPADLLGTYYMSYTPGEGEPLQGDVPLRRTSNRARFTDLVSVFGSDKAQAGLQALLVELGAGLERRGVDLNGAVAELRPALKATDDVVAEVGSQNADLRGLIDDSSRMARQVAGRDEDFDNGIKTFSSTLTATAERARAIDQGLQRSAPTVEQLRRTTGELSSTARAARPLARELTAVAPGLTQVTQQLNGFIEKAGDASRQTRPALQKLTTFLAAGAPTFRQLSTGLRSLDTAAPQIVDLMETMRQSAPLLSDALLLKLAGHGSEPGNQPLDPTTEPTRHLFRAAGVASCETFGLKIAPGCLTTLLKTSSSAAGRKSGQTKQGPREKARPESPAAPGAERPDNAKPALPTVPGLPDLLPEVKKTLDGLLPGTSSRPNQPAPPTATEKTERLLDFLLG